MQGQERIILLLCTSQLVDPLSHNLGARWRSQNNQLLWSTSYILHIQLYHLPIENFATTSKTTLYSLINLYVKKRLRIVFLKKFWVLLGNIFPFFH